MFLSNEDFFGLEFRRNYANASHGATIPMNTSQHRDATCSKSKKLRPQFQTQTVTPKIRLQTKPAARKVRIFRIEGKIYYIRETARRAQGTYKDLTQDRGSRKLMNAGEKTEVDLPTGKENAIPISGQGMSLGSEGFYDFTAINSTRTKQTPLRFI
ncbi:unnamed protein product [Microthlaspi erraticum]|uniref:Uncharacterized protein n=1 Tax=Microthlaspi erraticum TaxID=1685480 RepID=A0A6D2HXH2_9BRAS|nr:unnamed protein product [Microthlaspi erraticum]